MPDCKPLIFNVYYFAELVKEAFLSNYSAKIAHLGLLSGPVVCGERWLEVLGSSFFSFWSLGWKQKEDGIVGKMEYTGIYVIQYTFGILVSYLRENRPGHIDF